MATHSDVLAWRIPRTEEPGRLQLMGSQRARHNWAHTHTHTLTVQTSSMATSNTRDFKASLWCTRSKEMTGSILKCIYVILEHHEFSSITLRALVILPQTQLEMFKLVSIRRWQLSKERMSFEAATKILRNPAKSLNIKEKKNTKKHVEVQRLAYFTLSFQLSLTGLQPNDRNLSGFSSVICMCSRINYTAYF